MYCHECGAETDEGQSFCERCGAELVYQSETEGRDTDGSPTAIRTDRSDTSKTSSKGDAETETATARALSDDETEPKQGSGFRVGRVFEAAGSGNGSPADQSRELATNALVGYGFIVLLRLTGVSGVVFYFGGAAASGGSRLYETAVFVFYDGFILAFLGLLTSGYLVARFYLDFGETADGLEPIDRIAAIGLPGVSFLYGLGTIAAFLF